ncbi:MAG: hypothetical protein N2Z80_02085 [Hydrogenothermaceae bacterium]|nr:hypothetical protein [Hydrogenothermaceae bacterium]
MLKNVTISLIIILLSILSIYFYIISYKLWMFTFFLIDITVITFSVLLWFHDRQQREERGQRVISFPVKEMIKDLIYKQANMLKFDRVVEKEDGFEVYRGKYKVIKVEFEKDEKGDILQIDGKYVVRVEAPEYVLHNIDQEIWSHIGRKA